MLRIPFLRNILLVSAVFAIIFPLYDFFFIIPSYQKLLYHETEHEAQRFVRFLVSSNYLDQFTLTTDNIPVSLVDEVGHLKSEGHVVKLRIFSPDGEIVYSSDAQEIGTLNRKPYFGEIVSRGEMYSKTVKKKSITAEGVEVDIDLVETYVPVMVDDRFHGAMEVYTDVTSASEKLLKLSVQSFFTLLFTSVGLLLMTILLLMRARSSVRAQHLAEKALLKANEELEDRVGQRTVELSSANQQLSAEITERKKAQLAQKEAFVAISEARDRIDAIISSVADAMLVTDQQDKLILINPAAEELFEVKADRVLGKKLAEVIGFDELLLEVTKARNGLKFHETKEFDFVMPSDSGRKVFQVRASRLRDVLNNGRGLILLVHDVTRERQIDQMKSEFVSMAAHELQTPLTMILGYSELLVDKGKEFAENEQVEFLRIINDKSVELSRLIDDILDLSRIEDGRGMKLEFSRVDFIPLCQNILQEFQKTSLLHRFDFESPKNSCIADVDEARMIQLMENLLGNAVKYSPEGGEIKVNLSHEENWLIISVMDHGIGMNQQELSHAFERFYRGDSSNTAVRGTGLGLSIVRYVIDAHGGQVDLYSQKGEGTKVVVRLPAIKS